MQGIHPPPEVAADYQKVISAVQKKQALILQARTESISQLSGVVGSVKEAHELFDMAMQYRQAEDGSAEKEQIGNKLDSAFAQAKGRIFTALREAQSYRFETATLAEATSERFTGQLTAYQAAPEIYLQEQRLTTLENALSNIRKYVVVANEKDRLVIIVDVEEKTSLDIYESGAIPENTNP